MTISDHRSAAHIGRFLLRVGAFAMLVVAGPSALRPNDNTKPAGSLRDSILTLELEAVATRWHAEAGTVPGAPIEAFAERGQNPVAPGPLVRVPAGTLVRLRFHNALDRTLTFHLPTSVTTDDSVVVAAGATGDLATRLTTPGNYFYRATDGSRFSRQLRITGALAGAVVVDSAGVRTPPRDRVLVIFETHDSASVAAHAADTTLPVIVGKTSFTINGRSWPHTERLTATVGDTVHWRIINASFDVHPMHLHGFFYRVDEFSGPTAARDGQAGGGRMVVTERMSPYSAMSTTWVPERAGNWVLHCHFALHLVPPRAILDSVSVEDASVKPGPHDNHALTGMVGLVMAISVRPRPGQPTEATRAPERRLRLIALSDSGYSAERPSQRFVIEENGVRRSAQPGFSPSLYLTRGQPVAITIVNQLTERTAVHWHGMELESYFDGVAGLSGSGNHIAPTIAPGDSFAVRFAPPRAGTFMYHSHVDDVRQQRAGLVGAMIVQDGPPGPRPDELEIFLKTAIRPTPGAAVLDIGGQPNPDTLVLHAGRPTRFRLMSLATGNPNATVILTARPDSSFRNVRDTLVVSWTPVAKDGADLPAGARLARPARQLISMGETYDFEFTPARAGQLLRFEIRAAGQNGILLARVPLRIE